MELPAVKTTFVGGVVCSHRVRDDVARDRAELVAAPQELSRWSRPKREQERTDGAASVSAVLEDRGRGNDWETDPEPRQRLWRHLLEALPRRGASSGPAPLGDRLRSALLKPGKPGSDDGSHDPRTVEELQRAVKSTSDKERLVGLIAAPWAAGIGILVTSALIGHDPASRLADGQIDKLHVAVSLYHEVLAALLVMAVVMLVAAWLRKRLYLGIVLALYGLTLFNLHYWGFAIPFLMCGSWLLVRAYRLQKSVREATGDTSGSLGSQSRAHATSRPARPGANKRYTPPASRSRS